MIHFMVSSFLSVAILPRSYHKCGKTARKNLWGNSAQLHLRPSPDLFSPIYRLERPDVLRSRWRLCPLRIHKALCTFQALSRQKSSRQTLSRNNAVLPELFRTSGLTKSQFSPILDIRFYERRRAECPICSLHRVLLGSRGPVCRFCAPGSGDKRPCFVPCCALLRQERRFLFIAAVPHDRSLGLRRTFFAEYSR